MTDVAYGSWLCENAKPLQDDRRSYSSKTALGHQLAIVFNFKIELKNVILVAFRTFAFLHSQGQQATSPIHEALVRSTPQTGHLRARHEGNGPKAEVAALIRSPRARRLGELISYYRER
jgi:hypothetical protein